MATRVLLRTVAPTLLLVAALAGCEGEEPGGPGVAFNCVPGAENDTAVVIEAPPPGGLVAAGTELRWQRTGHDLCNTQGGIIDKRYSVAVCSQAVPGQCFPSNGFYNAQVKPAELGWGPTDPGSYTLSAAQIEAIRTGATPDLADGASVTFQIRYNYTNITNIYGAWTTRNLMLDLDQAPPAPSAATVLLPPASYQPNGPMAMNWQPVAGAATYTTRLVFRAGSPSGTDFGVAVGTADPLEVAGGGTTRDDPMPPATGMVVWAVAACNAGGCSDETIQGVLVQPPVPPQAAVPFSTIASAFRAPSCVNCHAVAATTFEVRPEDGYETGDNFGLPPGHQAADAGQNCTICHSEDLMPEGSHPVPWQAAPAAMDLRGRTDAELCQMARDPGSLAENITDHLLGDPLILWAVEGRLLPQDAGNTDVAFAGDWEAAVLAWVNGGAACP